MKNLIEILPNIYGVKVPLEWYYKIETLKECNEFEESVILIFDNLEYLNLPSGNFKILGTITATEISFDASEIVESDFFDDMDYDGVWIEVTRYWDYEYKKFGCMDSDESFRSALPKDIYFENPLKEPKGTDVATSSFFEMQTDYHLEKQHQTAQQNITEKLLILHKL